MKEGTGEREEGNVSSEVQDGVDECVTCEICYAHTAEGDIY